MDQDSAGGEAANQTPEELFAGCEAKAKTLTKKAFKELKIAFVQSLAFPLVFVEEAPPDTVPDTVGAFDAITKIMPYGRRYRDLVELLRKHRKAETIWWLLACWLKQEGISQPKDFLPPRIYSKMTKASRKRLAEISFTDFYYSSLVNCYRPYFERLLKDRAKAKERRFEEALIRAGYQSEAVEAAKGKRTAIPAVTKWLHQHKRVADARTIEVAHSRFTASLHVQ